MVLFGQLPWLNILLAVLLGAVGMAGIVKSARLTLDPNADPLTIFGHTVSRPLVDVVAAACFVLAMAVGFWPWFWPSLGVQGISIEQLAQRSVWDWLSFIAFVGLAITDLCVLIGQFQVATSSGTQHGRLRMALTLGLLFDGFAMLGLAAILVAVGLHVWQPAFWFVVLLGLSVAAPMLIPVTFALYIRVGAVQGLSQRLGRYENTNWQSRNNTK